MKIVQKILAIVILSTAFVPHLRGQAVVTNGLVAYYPFNGNANDAVGTNHGVVVGASLTTNRVNFAGAAYSFNGSSSRIDFSSPPLTQTDNWSLSAWVKPGNLSQSGVAVQIGFDNDNSGNGYGFGLFGDSRWQGILSGVAYLNSGTALTNANQWYHMVMLRDAGVTKFYVNGKQTSNTYTFTPKAPSDFTIGSQNGVRFFNGSVDDVRIYNRALSASEVTQIYLEYESCIPHTAKATATVTNGFVIGVNVTDSSCGYTNTPSVLIQGGGGSGATATATVTGGQISAINITSAGCCYTNVPTIVIQSPTFAPSLGITSSHVNITQHVMIGLKYMLESSPDLATWSSLGQPFTAQSQTLVTEVELTQATRYFRIRQVP